MRKLLLLAAPIALIPAAPAAAQVYVGVRGGATLDQSSDNQGEFTTTVPATPDFGAIPAGTSLGWDTDFDTGYDISGQLGYRFGGGLRIEAEVGYSDSKVNRHRNLAAGGAVIDGADVAVLTRGPASATNPTVGDILATDPGSVKTLYGFGNLYYDINSQGRFQPYFGVGLGVTRVDVDYRPSNVVVVDDKQTRFAYQLMGGATYKLSDNFEVFAQYTWRATPDRAQTDVTLLPATLGVESRQSIVGGGIRLAFGGGN
jgi:opacity protein-like surface antigen